MSKSLNLNTISKSIFIAFLVVLVFVMFSCNNADYYPKPRGYFRIDLPEKNYQTFDTIFPYQFEYPDFAQINFDGLNSKNPYWINIDYPRYRGRIHVSYKEIGDKNQLYRYTEDARNMAFKHAQKAIGIKESFFEHPENNVYGLAFEINGHDAASPYQFYITDSTQHFLRGALYFNVSPNNDSLEPVINFIVEDIGHMLSTFKWKESDK